MSIRLSTIPGWPDPAPGNGCYVFKPRPTGQHRCPLPAEWIPGAIWMCPDGHLWTVGLACPTCRTGHVHHRGLCTVGLAWWPATFWQCIQYGGRLARVHMANENRVRSSRHLTPPKGRAGQCPSAPKDFDA